MLLTEKIFLKPCKLLQLEMDEAQKGLQVRLIRPSGQTKALVCSPLNYAVSLSQHENLISPRINFSILQHMTYVTGMSV